MHPDPFHPSAPRSSGDPDHDELYAFWQESAAPGATREVRPLSWRARAVVALVAIGIAALIGAALLEGLARAEAMPPACDGLTRAACVALLSEGGAQ